MDWKQTLLAVFLPGIEAIGESALVETLQKLKESKPELYPVALKAGHLFVEALQPMVDKSANKFDDEFLKAFKEAIEQSALANGVILPTGNFTAQS